MSGLISLATTALGLTSDEPTADTVSIEIKGTRFQGWKGVQIHTSCETIPNSWTVTASTQFMQGPALAGTRPGQACKILIGDDVVITGWIDRRFISANAHGHDVILSGRGLTRNLVDCSASLKKDDAVLSNLTAPNALEFAKRLCEPFGIEAISAVSDLGKKIGSIVPNLGETPYQLIESVAQYAGFLVFENAKGQLVLDRVGTKTMGSGFLMPGNIEAIHAERSVDNRYSDYYVVWTSIDTLKETTPIGNARAHEIDKEMRKTEWRPLILVSGQNVPDADFGQQLAKWNMARRIGRSQAASVVCDSWRDSKGKLWTPNMLATIDAPLADIAGATWIIGSVTFRKDLGGTHCDLQLMPPDAFSPNPSPLNLMDRETDAARPTSDAPRPPSTQGQIAGPGHPA